MLVGPETLDKSLGRLLGLAPGDISLEIKAEKARVFFIFINAKKITNWFLDLLNVL